MLCLETEFLKLFTTFTFSSIVEGVSECFGISKGGPLRSLIFSSMIGLVAFSQTTHARSSGGAPTLAVSQGISYPSSSTLLNFRSGYTHQNAAGIGSLSGAQFSLEYADGGDSGNNLTGAELAIGNGTLGLALGFAQNSCDGCDSQTSAAAGYSANSWSMGIGFHNDAAKTVGFIFGGDSGHRLGVVGDLNDNDANNKIQSYGVGYAYVSSHFVFSLDASQRKDESTATNDEVTLITPGLLVKASSIQLSVSYDMYQSDTNNTFDDEVWVGLGFNQGNWDLNLYNDFVGEFAVNFIYRF